MIDMIAVFFQFLYRDFYVYFKRFRYYFINYVLIYPFVYILTFSYLAPHTLKIGNNTHIFMITLLSGNLLLITLNITFNLISPLLYDLESNRYIDFQMTRLSSHAILLEYIAFATLFGFIFLSPFFPLATIILNGNALTASISWVQLFVILFLGCLCAASYTIFCLCLLPNSRYISTFWIRFSIPLFVLGGFWVPWYVMLKASSTLAYLMLLNPFIYFTEGLRRALSGSTHFFSISTSASALLIFSMLFFIGACYSFKKKVDPV